MYDKQVNPFYRTKKWEKKRSLILRRDGYLCRECKRYGKTSAATTVHHINPLETYPDLAYVSDNLLSLCAACHGKMHDRMTNELTESGERWQIKIDMNGVKSNEP
ncbi:HNH endonuclease [Planococcus rifietoensis]|uniref:HNH endonuclease n=1 Tax=Planococcus rifietoensis TaxID=200991 RepID=UPI00384B6057